MFGAMGGTAFGLARTGATRRVGVVGARLRFKLFVSGTRQKNLEKFVETYANNAGESEANAEGGEVGGAFACLKIVVCDIQPGGRRAEWGRRRRKLKDIALAEGVVKEDESVILSKGEERPRGDLEDEFLNKGRKGEESKCFPIPKRHGLKRIPRREGRVKGVIVPSSLSLSGVIR
jgi:hypothetical protein